MRKILSIILVLCACFCLIGCTEKQENNFITITDMEGTEVVVPKNVSNVACISQSATDLMIAFGLGDKIKGTYRSFTYNPWTIELYPNAKNYKAYSYSVSAEELVSDAIDLVIIQDTENAESIRKVGIPVVAVHQYSPDGPFDEEIYDTARIIGEIFEKEAKTKAELWINEVKQVIEDIKLSIGEDNSDNPVYYINGEKQKGLFYSDGGNSMISRILDIANHPLATEKYEVLNVHKVSDEEMLNLNPYAIIIGGAYQNYLVSLLENSSVWSELDCYKQNRIYRIPVAMVGIENVSAETPVMLKYMASLLNESYKYDIYDGLRTNIKKYFGYDLSDSDIYNMCNGLDKNGERMVNVE